MENVDAVSFMEGHDTSAEPGSVAVAGIESGSDAVAAEMGRQRDGRFHGAGVGLSGAGYVVGRAVIGRPIVQFTDVRCWASFIGINP